MIILKTQGSLFTWKQNLTKIGMARDFCPVLYFVHISPVLWSEILDFHIEERQESRSTERTGAVEVGIICCPACHNLFIVHQTVTRLTERTARHQHL